ncbi:MAG: CHAP domain-containing protein, partial [Erysipelotrichaceae bacterium]|nr:CHAP domain-containing protein [Erysipelotrichaceae bacterium]
MKDTVKEYLESSKKHSSRSRKLVAILLVLSLVTATGVSWSLHKQGQSMAMDAKCGQEEHTHTPECFTRELICGKQETAGHTHSDSCYQEGELICQEQEAEAHTHSDACYRETLTCSKPVHTHTLQCYSDPAADVETAEVWEEPIKKLELTGDYGKDVVAVAKTQLGYQESQNNYQAAEDGQTKKGWNRYGAWYGNPYADWDATFASFCLNYAKVPNYPLSDNAAKWVEKLSEQSLYVTAEGASEGCLVFLDKNEDQAPDHVGIVEEIKDGEVKVIEGDMNDVVQSNTYQLNDPRITGFGKLPAKIDENAAVTKTVECGDYTITVTYDSSANIP